MKKLVAILSAGILAVTSLSVVSSAEYDRNGLFIVQDVGGSDKRSTLRVSGRDVTCESIYYSDKNDVNTIYAKQTLEKMISFNRFSSVTGASFSTTVSGRRMDYSNNVSGLSQGKYRLKTVFTVKYKNGRSETVTVYSTEITIK